jgi:prepilin-type N-terminal cleavage/methylation domain-containing protein/prepilin-type processing-associated H-X9-DG protein
MMARRSLSLSYRLPAGGFTLVELLTVVAILVILVSISVPAVARFIESGKEATTASRLRQVHTLQMAYASDNNGQLTPFFHPTTNRVTWHQRLLPYLSIVDKVGAKEDPRLILNSPYQKIDVGKQLWEQGTSFGLNNFMESDNWNFRLARVQRPSSIIMAGDMGQGRSDYVHTSEGLNHHGRMLSWGLPAYRHRGKSRAMMLFMDGHTKLLTEEELKLQPAGGPSLWRWW